MFLLFVVLNLKGKSKVKKKETGNGSLKIHPCLGSGVAQLVERSLPNPEVLGSNPVIGKLVYRKLYCQLY